MSYLADDTQAIAARMKELRAERDEVIKGTSAPVTGQEQKTETEMPYGYGYAGLYGIPGTASTSGTTRVTIDPNAMSSLAHPEWPYAGTGFEWRKFVRS